MIYITGDTHAEFHRFSQKTFSATADDYVIICGDFGGVWDRSAEQKYWLDWLAEKPWTTLFVDGNHENYDLLATYPVERWHDGNVHFIRDNEVLTMTRTALAKAIRQLSEYQIDKLQKMVLEYSLLNHELEAVRPETCPKCGADEHSLMNWISNEAVFQCDGAQSYNDLIAHKNCRKIELKGKEDYDKVHHLNTVNGLHNQFKHMIRKFRGVSTIYLNRYLALFVFLMRGFDRNIAELADTVRHSMMGIRVPATLISLKSASILVI